MGFFRKLLLAGLGWSLGGPIGAIIGIALASLFDGDRISAGRQIGGDDYSSQNDSSSQTTTKPDFVMSLMVLLAAIMKADGEVKKSELNVVKDYLRKIFDEETALEALQILKKLLQQSIDVDGVAMQIRTHLNLSAKRELLHLLFRVAFADGVCADSELQLIEHISQLLGVPDSDFKSIKSMFGIAENKNWAYDVLEISPEAADDEVKKAYRKMAMKYHPDRVNTLGEEVRKSAEEKFKKVHEAYEEIKRQRGLV